MILSCNRVLKAGTVSVDQGNKVVIDVAQNLLANQPIDTEDNEIPEPDKMVQAQNAAKRIIRQAEQQAEEILANARNSAIKEQSLMLNTAKAEAARITSEARDIGYREGMDAAVKEGEAIKAEAKQVLENAIADKTAMQANLEPEIVEIITGITEKLLNKAVVINPAIITNLIKQGLSSAIITGDVIIYVSPDDLEQVQSCKEELMAYTDGSVKLEIVKDLSLNSMDCIIETSFGDIDCSLGQQFETLKANLSYILNNK
ncbi:MAG: FliH/SctL family protein [Defluviitaleaceae bacterium]|nr:FliH/SctL family protein [Defluviitaleaceae bacterium]